MATAFLDTSVVVRRYDDSEPDSDRVLALCDPNAGNTIILAQFTPVEVASALSRKARDGQMEVALRDDLWTLFLVHLRSQYHSIDVTNGVLDQAMRLVFRYRLRALDALQVASAQAAIDAVPTERFVLWTADRRQADAAQGEGIETFLLA